MEIPPISDAQILVKYKTAGMKDEVIAAKLGITVEQVEARWKEILARASRMVDTGYDALCTQYTILSTQYQLLGESLKIIAAALGDVMPMSEIEPLIIGDADDVAATLRNLSKSCIILRPFTPVNPVESLQQRTEAVQKSN